LTYLWKGNEVTTEDVIQDVSGADGYNEINKFSIVKSNWHECSNDQLRRIAKGRIHLKEHSKDEFMLQEDEDEIEPPAPEEKASPEDPQVLIQPAQNTDDIRENFSDVFMFKDFKTNSDSNTSISQYTVPDSITSWMVSAFSMSLTHGLAIAPTKELVVKKNFFTKLSLPYSIRYKEKLRVDIVIHNYIDPKENLTVDVTMFERGPKKHLKFYDNLCATTPNSIREPVETVTVESFQVKRVSFYIQSNSGNEEFEQKPKYVNI